MTIETDFGILLSHLFICIADMLEFGVQERGVKYTERPGAYGVAVRDGLVLLVKNPGGYFLPGGGIDPGENPEAALKREFVEEIGLDITIGKKIGEAAQYLHIVDPSLYIKKIGYFYMVELGEKVSDMSEDNHSEEWVTLAFAEKNLFREFHVWAVQEAFKFS